MDIHHLHLGRGKVSTRCIEKEEEKKHFEGRHLMSSNSTTEMLIFHEIDTDQISSDTRMHLND